jgi:hypothetical protein
MLEQNIKAECRLMTEVAGNHTEEKGRNFKSNP